MKNKLVLVIMMMMSTSVGAKSLTIPIHEALPTGQGQLLGEIIVSELPYGLLFTPKLSGLIPGIRGFHIHEHPDCSPDIKEGKSVAAAKAGGHWDPQNTGKHLGPYNDKGHLGDLPGLVVNADGSADYAVLAPRIKSIKEIKGHSLMIHIGGDNYSDHPHQLGGGGSRVACGVIE